MRTGTASAVLLTAMLLAGCGGANDKAQPAPDQPAATATPSATETAEAAPTKVAIAGFEYEPASLTVEPGTKVTWVNEDTSNHTVTFQKGPGDLGNVDEGGKLSAGFDEAGSYSYVCQYHPNMEGRIRVR